MGKPQQIQGTKIRSFAQFPCRSITCLHSKKRCFSSFCSEVEKFPPHACKIAISATKCPSGRACCKCTTRKVTVCGRAVFPVGFVARWLWQNHFEVMFLLCFGHTILVLGARLCDEGFISSAGGYGNPPPGPLSSCSSFLRNGPVGLNTLQPQTPADPLEEALQPHEFSCLGCAALPGGETWLGNAEGGERVVKSLQVFLLCW